MQEVEVPDAPEISQPYARELARQVDELEVENARLLRSTAMNPTTRWCLLMAGAFAMAQAEIQNGIFNCGLLLILAAIFADPCKTRRES